ncbi:MAG TPA: hypothetical protein PLJ35_19555 [Anaerolineae bacterium]|nr:hypothetical protein [Anaerolineae bacterium]HOR01018.1 hypothetical protein [Anaerolineae bacterium]HPL29176.1 hypothetical protein [Anaerolineae bacterium]
MTCLSGTQFWADAVGAGPIVSGAAYWLTAISAYWVAAALALLFFALRRRRDMLSTLIAAALVWLILRGLGAILRVLVPCVAPDAEASFGFVVALVLSYLLPLRLWQRVLCIAIVAAAAVTRFVAVGCQFPGELALALGAVALAAALFWLLSRWRPARRLWQRVALTVDNWSARAARTSLTPPLVAVLAARLRQHLGFTLEELQPLDTAGVHASTPVVLAGRDAQGRPCRYFAKIVTSANWRTSIIFELENLLRPAGRRRGPLFSSLKGLVDHEHYMLLLFSRLGVPAPQPRGAYRLERQVYALVTDYLEGAQPFREAGLVSAGYVAQALRALRRLRDADCAHGDIKSSNLVILPGDRFVFVDLAMAEYIAGPRRLARDLADLLAILAIHHDPEAVVATAREIVGGQGLRQARSYLHRSRLNTETQQLLPLDMPGRLRRLIARGRET